jgi:hypothetical protein
MLSWGLDVVISYIKWQLRVDLTGDQTPKLFDMILINFGRTASGGTRNKNAREPIK